MALSSNKYALIAPGLEKTLAQNSAPKVPEWQSYRKFPKIHPKPAFFWKRGKGGPREIFKKIAQKVALAWKAEKHSGTSWIIL